MACSALSSRRRPPGAKLARPAALALAAAAGLAIGALHFQNAWPGTGGTSAHRALMPGGLAAFSWASTLSISSYWAHPDALHRFPGPELAWMVISPVAALCLVGAAATLVRRQPLSPRLLAYEGRVAQAAALALGTFLAGAGCWVLGQGSAAPGLFHAGAIDIAGLGIMTAALAVAVQAARCCRQAAHGLRSR